MPRSPSTAAGKAPRSAKGAATRARLLHTARRLLIDEGYDALAMRAVAAGAEVKLGNLQYYFPTRDALLEALVREEAETDLADLKHLAGAAATPSDRLTEAVRLLAAKWRGESGRVLGLMTFLAQHQPGFRRIYREVYEGFYDALTEVIEQVRPELDRGERRRRARLITALTDGAALQVSRGSSTTFLDDVAAQALKIARD